MKSWKKGFNEGREKIRAYRKAKEEEQAKKHEEAEPSPIARRAGAMYERAAPYVKGAKQTYTNIKRSSAQKRPAGSRPDPWAGLNRLSGYTNQPPAPQRRRARRKKPDQRRQQYTTERSYHQGGSAWDQNLAGFIRMSGSGDGPSPARRGSNRGKRRSPYDMSHLENLFK